MLSEGIIDSHLANVDSADSAGGGGKAFASDSRIFFILLKRSGFVRLAYKVWKKIFTAAIMWWISSCYG